MPDDTAPAVGKLPIKMLHDRILVALRKEDGDRRSTGGILIPATAQVAKRLVWGEARGTGLRERRGSAILVAGASRRSRDDTTAPG